MDRVLRELIKDTQRLSTRVSNVEAQEPLEYLRFIIITAANSPFTAARGTVIICDTTDNNITVNLPQAVLYPGREYYVHKLVADNVVTVDGYGTELINGSLTYTLNDAAESVHLLCTGTYWISISKG